MNRIHRDINEKGINDGMVNCKWFLTEGEEKPREISMFWKKRKEGKKKRKKETGMGIC